MTSRYPILGLLVGMVLAAAQGCSSSKNITLAPDDAASRGSGGNTSIPPYGGELGSGGSASVGIDAAAAGGSTAPTCGQPGLPCCSGNGCTSGGCCVSGICMAEGGACVGLGGGVCRAGACGNCGGPGQPCCGSNPATGVCTSPGTLCSGGTCSKCGDLGALCCPGANGGADTCNSPNAVCDSTKVCMACGTPGSACCPGNACNSLGCCYNNVCAAAGAACGTGGGTCQAGRCSACGNASQPCCSNLCYDGLLCKGGTCTACGGVGQTCCSTTSAACQAGLLCTSSAGESVCARCGGLGDVCCAGNACTDGCCSGGRCLAPGSAACPIVPPDAGVPRDAPMADAGGTGGTGGIIATGAGGVIASGGTKVSTGGMVGGTVQTGGTGGTTLPPWTVPAGCGDGVLIAPERCDDGNTMPFDGCSSDCQIEPTCTGVGPCTSKCGDGIVVGEDCDDGNGKDGDGCSSSCKVEAGFACAQPALGSSILVPVVYRDFRFHNPADFEGGVSGVLASSPGMVAATLDSEGKPIFSGLTGSGIHVASKDSFAMWYRNTPGVNHATASKLPLWSNGGGAFVNRWGANGEPWPVTKTALYCGSVGDEALDADGKPIPCTMKYATTTDCDSNIASGLTMLRCTVNLSTYRGIFLVSQVDGNPFFFPVDGDSFTPLTEQKAAQIPPLYSDGATTWEYDVDDKGTKIMHNFSFTSEFRYWFKYEADKAYRLDITGDDDVWVFINKQLAVDLGGIHTPVVGSVTLDSAAATKYGLTAGNVYEVKVFQAERQSTSSTFKITLNGFSTAASSCRAN